MSAPTNEQQAEIDKHVNMLVSLGDVDIICDINPGVFWQKAEQYIENVAETTVDERRHECITHLAIAVSVSHLLQAVQQTCPPDLPIPSANWLRLQFWPKNPPTHAALQNTGRLRVKYMVQQRHLRAHHEEAHYASAAFRYLKEMALRFHEYCAFLSVDDTRKVKGGEPGTPLAAIERGRQVLVSMGQTFQVADHDFSKMTLTPSVILDLEVPATIEGSFCGGKVHVALKDSVFTPSSPARHGTETSGIMKDTDKPILMLYSDGGPDHRVNYVFVQLSLITLWKKHGLDALVAVHTPPDIVGRTLSNG